MGFNDVYRVGCWTPVEVVLHGGAEALHGRVELSLLDGDGMASEIVSDELTLPAGKQTRVLLYAKFGRLGGNVTAAFSRDEEILFKRVFTAGADADADFSLALPSADRLIVQLGAPIGIEDVVARQRRDSPERVVLVGLESAGQLPTRWCGYEGVDTLVLSAAEEQLYAAVEDGSRVALQVLEEWVEMGGRIILASGNDAPRLLDPESPLARFAPGKFTEMLATPRTASLETYSGVTSRVEVTRGEGIQAIRLDAMQGTVELGEGELPLIVRAPRVFGRVTFLAIDLSRKPLSQWSGRVGLVERLLGRKPCRGSDEEQDIGRTPAVHLGITDLAGQLRGALDQFSEIELAPFWLVAGLIFVYLLLIGPLDFFLHRNVTRRMALSWVSFPLWVVLFMRRGLLGSGPLEGR